MFIDSGGTAIACLDKGMLHELEQVIGDTEVSLEFLPAVNPTTVVLTPQYTSASCNIQIDNGALLQTRTVMTSYMQTDVMVLASVTRNTVLLPWCSKQHFVNWVTLLAGVPGQRPVHPEWFFAMNGRACSGKKKRKGSQVLWQIYQHGKRMKSICRMSHGKQAVRRVTLKSFVADSLVFYRGISFVPGVSLQQQCI